MVCTVSRKCPTSAISTSSGRQKLLASCADVGKIPKRITAASAKARSKCSMKLPVLITNRDSNKAVTIRQLWLWPCMKIITRLALMVAICIGQFSCTSIYHRTQRHLPPEPTAELRLRLAEAAEAENLAKQAAVKLFDNLQREKPGTMIDTDFDRLEAAA